MSTVYIVTAGGYADYRIVAVFSTEEFAKVHIEKGQLERACIERYDLDPPSEWRSITNVCMRHDGSTFNISTELVYEQGPGYHFFRAAPAPCATALAAQIATDSEAEAIKQTDAIRLRLIADGEWPPVG